MLVNVYELFSGAIYDDWSDNSNNLFLVDEELLTEQERKLLRRNIS